MAANLHELAKAYAIRIVNAQKYLLSEKQETRISDQLKRSGTAVMALLAEAQYAQSRADFINKLQVALKEANESRDWLNLLHDTGYIDDDVHRSIIKDVSTIIFLLVRSINTAKSNAPD